MITITVQPQSSKDMAILGEALARLLAANEQPEAEQKPVESLEQANEEKPAKKSRKASAAAAAAEQSSTETATASTAATSAATQPAPATAPTAAAAPAPAPASPSKGPTLVDVRAKLAALSQAGKADEVKALLKKYGATKLTDVAEDKYGLLLDDAEALA